MRIGVAVTRTGVTGAVVLQCGKRRSAGATAGSLSEQIEAVLRELLSCAESDEDQPTAITADISGILAPDTDTPVTIVRIAPRPPIDVGHEMLTGTADTLNASVVHIAGGHEILGEELVPLDGEALAQFARNVPRGGRYVVSGVGSLVNASHELRAGRILLEHADPESIEYAHRFASGAIAVREQTALLNSSLLENAANIGTSLGLVVEQVVPQARLYVTTNDGGSTSMGRLTSSPVHSLHAGKSTELIGAAALCGIDDGRLIVAGEDSVFFGEILSGVPTVVPTFRDADGGRLATQAANLLPLSESVVNTVNPPLLVTSAAHTGEDLGIPVHLRSDENLRALGAACAPLADWANRIVNVNNAEEMSQAVMNARARVEARLVSFGSTPSWIRILESRVIATAYQHPRVVSVRVRGVAGESSGTILSGGDRAAHQ